MEGRIEKRREKTEKRDNVFHISGSSFEFLLVASTVICSIVSRRISTSQPCVAAASSRGASR